MKEMRLLILTLINCLLFINILLPQNTWQTEGVLGGASETRHRAVAFSIGNKGYVGTGTRGSFGNTGWKEFKDFWEYNPTTHVWTQLADVGGTTRFDAIGFSIGDKGYIGTGRRYSSSMGGNVKLQDFWEYNSVTNTWSSVSNILGGVRAGAVAFTIGNKAYVGTGSNSSTQYSQDFYEFDPINNTWTQKKSFEGTGRELAAGFSTCGKGYIGTGLVGSNTGIGDFWEYNPSKNEWIPKGNFSGGSSYGSKGFSICTKGYILKGAENGNCDSKKFWEYDPNSDSWLELADFPTDQRYQPVAFNIGGKGYIGTGKRCGQEIYFGDFFSYTPFESNVPDKPFDIIGKHQVCVNEIQIYYTPYDECVKTYNWTVPQNATINKYSIKKDTITIKFASNSGNISVTASNDCGTSKSFSIPITVNALPNAQVSGINSICNGLCTDLTATGGGTYLWSTGATSSSINVCPTSTTTYIVTVTNNLGCSATASRIVTVNALPNAQVSGINTICIGLCTDLTVSGGGTYLWNTGATTSTINVCPISTTTYTVTVTSNLGCSATASRIVTVNALPNAQVSGINSICNGLCTDLTVTGGGTYLWSTGATSSSINVCPTSTTTYTVTVTNNLGCSATASRIVTVNALPNAQVSGINTICSGLCTDLTVSGGGTYLWNTGATSSSINVCPTSTTTYTVTVTSNLGCSATASRIVTVNALPNAQVSGINTICSGLCTDLIVSGGGTYLWNTGATSSSINVCPTSITTYTVTVTSNLGCSATASRIVTVNPSSDLNFEAPQNSGICPLIVDLYNRSITSNPVEFEWTIYNDVNRDSIKFYVENPKGILYKEAGDFRTILKITDDCGTNTIDSIIRVICIVGTENNINEIDFSVYPNPTDGYITVVQSNNLENGKCKLTLINSIGKIIEVHEINNSDITTGKTFDLRNYNNGIYFVIISNSQMHTCFKISKL